MGFPLITFNSRTINFTQKVQELQVDSPRRVISSQSASGIVETLKIRADVEVVAKFHHFVNATAADATLRRYLEQWSVWAQEGRAWNFGLDSDHTVFTTITVNAAAGATALTLTTLTGVVVNGLYILRNALTLELVKVTALNSPGAGQVTLAEPLTFSYFSGDRFRSERVWPARLLTSTPIIERPPLWYDVELKFQEDVNLL